MCEDVSNYISGEGRCGAERQETHRAPPTRPRTTANGVLAANAKSPEAQYAEK